MSVKLVDAHLELETPEGVLLRFELAGPGPRMLAYTIDLAIRIAVGFLTGQIVLAFFTLLGRPVSAVGVILVIVFLLEWGYGTLFEGFWNGRTPGKHALGLRVVRTAGQPLRFSDAALRNLLRAADFWPVGYGAALVAMLLTARMQRLGDLVAGTMVIRQRRVALPETPLDLHGVAPLPRSSLKAAASVSERTLELIERVLHQRERLGPNRVEEIARPLASAVSDQILLDPPALGRTATATQFLLRVLVTFADPAGAGLSDFSGDRAEDGPRIAADPHPAAADTLPGHTVPSTLAQQHSRRAFIRARLKRWKSFEQLLDTVAARGLHTLDGDDWSRFSALYRAACYDLSLVRARDWGRQPERYLNHLTQRGHDLFYRLKPIRRERIGRFFAADFPCLLRHHATYLLAAAALFMVPMVVCGTLVLRDPELASRFLPAQLQQRFEEMYRTAPAERPRSEELNVVMAGFYIRNNIGVAFRCFALGVFAGVGTALLLVYNGMLFGVVGAYLWAGGLGGNFVEFVIGHGAFELTAIVVAGAAGLMLGHAVVDPGPLSRWDALRLRAAAAVRIVLGAAAMLAVAAMIEGFWSPSAVPRWIKVTVGTLLWLLVLAYVLFAGRASSAPRSDREDGDAD